VVRHEIELFQEMGKSKQIIPPLLIAGEPNESFLPELRRRRVAVPRATMASRNRRHETRP
jgi:hypothetical protein